MKKMLIDIGVRVDAMSLDLARDVGAVVRNARAVEERVREVAEQASSLVIATPRAAKLAQAAAGLFARYRWLQLRAAARDASGGDDRPRLSEADHRDLARRAVAVIAELRGGVAKLGQLASCRPDLVGAVWASELAALQDDVPPIDTAAIRARVDAEIGMQWFADFDDAPIAAASLAQVHGATLRDGTRVVVKVQVPGIEHAIAADIAALRAIATIDLPGADLPTLADELARALRGELDYRAEADALDALAASGTTCVVPRPIRDASSERVLTMTRIDGEPLIAALDAATPADRDRLLGALVGEIAAQVLARGFVHADPHPGNVMVTCDGRLALLDLGCVLSLARDDRRSYARLALALGTGDATTAAAQLAGLGFVSAQPALLVELASSLVSLMRPGQNTAELDYRAAIDDQIARARAVGELAIPPSFVLLGRVLATLAGLLARYKPDLQLHAIVAPHLFAAAS
nr:AarF/UbiB family protein [Kofleriaceae bacterium]